MTEAAAHLEDRRSRWSRAWAVLRDRAAGRQDATTDDSVAFAELVWAHYQRQELEVAKNIVDGPWEQEYRRRLARFTKEHGRLVEVFWCRFEASGIAVTAKELPRRARDRFRSRSILRVHTATDWRTTDTPQIAASLHAWELAAIKAQEVLRGTSEKIVLHQIFAASSHLLACADRKRGARGLDDAQITEVVREQERERALVAAYYNRAGQNSARIVYFDGMVVGTIALALGAAAIFAAGWAFGWVDPHHQGTQTLFVSIAMGAAGAILSVMTRMAKRDGISLEFEVGRKSMRFLGSIRPWIGALSALVVYMALQANLLEILPDTEHGVYYYATIAFASGFSERRAKVLLDRTLGDAEEPAAQPQGGESSGRAPADDGKVPAEAATVG